MYNEEHRNRIQGALLGVAVGDALGVPVEFTSRAERERYPVKTMQGHGTHDQPPGTWSDDTSLTLCLAENVAQSIDLEDLAQRFINWYDHGYWSAHGVVFDIGIATRQAIERLKAGVAPTEAGLEGEYDNGNGALMRILPLTFTLGGLSVDEQALRIRAVASLTHRHVRSTLACVAYAQFARLLLAGYDKHAAYELLRQNVADYVAPLVPPNKETALFERVWPGDIRNVKARELRGSGYVLHTLEASLWAFLTTDTFAEAVLTAVNLGEDTDTTGAVTGGLAGLYYGADAIPERWLNVLARREDIVQLADQLADIHYS